MRTAFAVGDAPAGAKSPAFGKGQLWSQDQLFGRAHPARRSTDVGKSSLGALLRERKVTGRDASLPAPLWTFPLEWSHEEQLGRCPKPYQRRCLWTPQGEVFPLQGQGTASLVGFGATPQLFFGRSIQRDSPQRRRQRSVPASNFALPQKRPQAALSTIDAVSRQMGATKWLVFQA